MERDSIGMSQREQQRYHLLKMVVEGNMISSRNYGPVGWEPPSVIWKW
jgi:hypothetical protein